MEAGAHHCLANTEDIVQSIDTLSGKAEVRHEEDNLHRGILISSCYRRDMLFIQTGLMPYSHLHGISSESYELQERKMLVCRPEELQLQNLSEH